MTDDTLPTPPIPADADLRHFEWFPLYHRNLMNSDFWLSNIDQPEVIVAALKLWIAAWNQVPAGSLPDNDIILAHLAGISDITKRRTEFDGCMDLGERKTTATDVLSERLLDAERTLRAARWGWERHSDGRLYHEYLTKIVLKQLSKSTKQRAAAHETNKKKKKKQQDGRSHAKRTHSDAPSARSAHAQHTHSDTLTGGEGEGEGKRKGESFPPTPPTGDRARGPEAGLASDRDFEQRFGLDQGQSFAAEPGASPPSGASPPYRGGRLDPITGDDRATRQTVYDDAATRALCGMTHTALVDLLHQACAGSNRLIAGSKGLERAVAVIDLLREHKGLTVADDVVPAIKAKIARPGDRIGSWAYFRDAILGWHQNRISGTAQGTQAPARQGPPYGPNGRWGDWWPGKPEGEAPPGHPWTQKIKDPRTHEIRRNCGYWDWQWYDAAVAWQRDGKWDEAIDSRRPGRWGSSCPDEIVDALGIEREVTGKVVPIRPVVELTPEEEAEANAKFMARLDREAKEREARKKAEREAARKPMAVLAMASGFGYVPDFSPVTDAAPDIATTMAPEEAAGAEFQTVRGMGSADTSKSFSELPTGLAGHIEENGDDDFPF